MEGYDDEQMASSLSYDDDLAQGYDDDDAAYRHTQFLDLTNGEGGSREAYYMGDSDDDGGGGGGGGPDTGAETVAAIDTSTPGKVVETGQEHTGRWTREEHAAFLSALKTYGKEWKKVAAKVKTRTVVQTRTHAQKYFQKLHKAMNQNDKSVTSVEMGVAAEAKKVSAQKKKKAKPQRSQSTASTHAAAHVMTHLSSAQMPTTSSVISTPYAASSYTASAYSSTPYAAHGFSTPSNNDQPLRPPQALPLFPPSGGFFTRDKAWNNPMSIVAPEPDVALRMGKFPEPSPAACGKRKLAEIAAAQMLAGVAASKTDGDVTPPPVELPELPLTAGSSSIAPRKGLSLQIVNPESLGVTYDAPARRKHGGEASPTTPWDGQLEALVSEARTKVDERQSQEDENGEMDNVKPAAVEGNGHSQSLFPHPVCGPGTLFGRTSLHKAVCSMDASAVQNELLFGTDDVVKRDELGYCPLHTACALSLLDPSNNNVASDISQILISGGADASCLDSNGNTPLHWAARAGDEAVAHLLLLKNCPPDIQNDAGETALHWAMRAGRRGMAVIRLLLDNGARVVVFNKQHKRPIDVPAEGFPDDTSDLKKASESKGKKPNRAVQKKKMTGVIEEKREVRANLFRLSAQSRSLVLYHPECLEHVAKAESDWEVPDRVQSIMRRILPGTGNTETTGIFPYEVTVSCDFDRAKLDLLSRVHSADYLGFVNELSKDLERKQKEVKEEEHESSQQMPTAVPFTPMVQRTVLKEADFKNIKQAAHSDTSFSAGSLRAARRAAGAVQHAVDCVLVGRNRNAFCVVRPPGHHAGIKGLLAGGESCGFCIFNNVAAGALHAISDERDLCKRCAIVDLDVHHGNGTEEIVRNCHDPGRLLFFSIHLYDNDKKRNRGPPAYAYKFYPGTGEEDDLAHNIINVPITPLWREQDALSQGAAAAVPQNTHNTRQKVKQKSASATNSPRESLAGDDGSATENTKASDTESETASRVSKKSGSSTPASSPRYTTTGRHAYRRAIQDRLLPALRAFNPDLILISAGFDAAKGDVGNARHYVGGKERMGMDLEPDDYAWGTRKILEIADICCQGRVVSVLEGGYGRTPISKGDPDEPMTLDKTVFAECAIRHLQAMIDPYDEEARFSGS